MTRVGRLAASAWLQVLLTFVLALAGAAATHRLWQVDLTIPFEYQGDGLQYLMYAKSIHDHGWMLENGSLGAPFALLMYDWPEGGWFSLIGVRLFDALSGNFVVAHHLLYLLGYPLAALACLWALRRLAVAPALAIALSVLYALMPYHMGRGEGHYILGLYYGLPPILAYAITTAAGREPIPLRRGALTRGQWLRRAGAAVLAGLLAGLMSVYYVAFAGILLLAGGMFGWLHSRRKRVLLSTVLLSGVVVVALVVQYAPMISYRLANGPNRDVAARFIGETENYPLKPADMLLPVPGHPVPALAELRAHYQAFPSPSGPRSALGLLGSAGLLAALAAFALAGAARARRGSLAGRLRPAGSLIVVAVGVGMLGGGATFVALFIGPYLRAWDRISIAIAFLALAALGIALTVLRRRVARPRRGLLLALLAALVVVVGAVDQAGTAEWVRPRDSVAPRWHNDATFVAQVESMLEPGAMVYQLPYVPFPEGRRAILGVNENLRPYMHSTSLRWSTGLMAGRDPGWQVIPSVAPVADRLALLRTIGFAGVYVDRDGYPATSTLDQPSADEIVALLAAELGAPAVQSPDGQLLFFALPPQAVDERARADALDPVWVRAASGLGLMRLRGEHVVRSVSRNARVELHNERPDGREVEASFALESASDRRRTLEVEWPDGVIESLTLGAQPLAHRRRFALPSGRSHLQLRELAGSAGGGLTLLDLAVVDESMAPSLAQGR